MYLRARLLPLKALTFNAMQEILFNCPHCKNPLYIDTTAQGTQIICPLCHRPFDVPAAVHHSTRKRRVAMGATVAVVILCAFAWFAATKQSEAVDLGSTGSMLTGTWYTTNGTGRILVFGPDASVRLFATATKGTFFNNSTYDGTNVGFVLEGAKPKPILRFLKRNLEAQGTVDEIFRLIGIADEQMILERISKNPSQRKTVLRRLDVTCLTSDEVIKKLPPDGYVFVPSDTTTVNINDF